MNIVVQISLILVLSTLIGAIFRFLRQPLLVGYIVTGIILGPSVLQFLTNPHEIEVFSQLGISILLFIVGLVIFMSYFLYVIAETNMVGPK